MHQCPAAECCRRERALVERLPQTILESVALIPLPTLPQVLVRFLALIDDERATMADLAAVADRDPALAAQLVTIASSPPYRRETTDISLEQLLDDIGKPLLRALASCMAVQNSHTQTIYERNFDYAGFWRHSLLVAALARALAVETGYRNAGEAYLAGLFHDIGQLLLVGGVGEFCTLSPGEGVGETGAAGLTQVLNGIDLAGLGARLVDGWHLSSFMADAVLFHQFSPEQISPAGPLCRIVWSAHRLGSAAGGIETLDDPPGLLVIPAILGLDGATVIKACRSAHAWVGECVDSLGVQAPVPEAAVPASRFIYPYVSLPKRDNRDSSRAHLEALARNMAVMQPLQECLPAFADESGLCGALRETARLLFALPRPVFLLLRTDRSILAVADSAGQSPLLSRLELPPDPEQSLAASAFRTKLPVSSFDDASTQAPRLLDIQLARLLGSQGLLCIPMGNGDSAEGVMVFGLSREQYVGRRRALDWMTAFARLAARSLGLCRTMAERERKISAELTSQFEQKARKVIHETVNPLGIINNYLKIFSEKLVDAPDVQGELNILKEEISRVERIVRRLNEQPEPSSPVETVNVNALIDGMMALYGESLFEARGIAIDKQLDPGAPLARADRDSLKQILFNLWKNSSEAMPQGGSFLIATSTPDGDAAGCAVEIRLGDTGPGIPPEVMARLFQPLDPDRSSANSGVGLSIVASLVERLGGEISCNSSPGQGTTFTIRLARA